MSISRSVIEQYWLRSALCGRLLVLTAIVFSVTSTALSQGLSTPFEPDRIRQTLATGTSEQKRDALFEIRNRRDPVASALAVPALKDPDAIVRATAASSVVFLPVSEAAVVLLPLLDDRSPFVRKEAAFALGTVGHWSATPRLAEVLRRDRDREVRTSAAIALGMAGDIESIGPLSAILKNRPKEEDEMLRRAAARSLGQVAELIRSGGTRVTTPQSFLPERFKETGDPLALKANRINAESRPTVELLVKVLSDTREADDTRREAAFALGAFGRPEAIPALERSIAAADPYLAETAREALLKIRAADGN